ncbi:hypothetical protein ABZX92_10090 [Lentzea sp. NPDC006480]|uniref:hypothetical protein n=1 Tax=Lentzea sp. NPDC006480 TaxID=3157176 RepID=UPI00339FFDFF
MTRPDLLPLRERLLRAGVLLPAPRESQEWDTPVELPWMRGKDQVRGGSVVAK